METHAPSLIMLFKCQAPGRIRLIERNGRKLMRTVLRITGTR